MANTKSAIKRLRSAERRRLRNRVYRVGARTAVKKARALMEEARLDEARLDEGHVEEARAAVRAAVSALDKAAEKGIIHKNNASRRKSRLMRRLAQIERAV